MAKSKKTSTLAPMLFEVEYKPKEEIVKSKSKKDETPQKEYLVNINGIGDGKDFGNYIENRRSNKL